jgi:hypothetical protein
MRNLLSAEHRRSCQLAQARNRDYGCGMQKKPAAEKYVTVTIRLHPVVRGILRKEAARLRQSQSAVVAQLLGDFARKLK